MLADIDADTRPKLTIVRRLNARVAAVYAAWTEPEHLLHWWAPKDGITFRAETDVRVGGGYNIAFRTSDGEVHELSGTYLVVIPLQKLVFTWAWRTRPEHQSQVTATFKDVGGQTLLTVHHEKFLEEADRDSHRQGWSEGLDKLAAHLAR